MRNHLLSGTHALCCALLIIGLPFFASAQKVVTLDNYSIEKRPESSKVSSDLLKLMTPAMTNARMAAPKKTYDYPNALKVSGKYVTIEAIAKNGKGAKLLAQLKKEVGLEKGVAYKHMVSGQIRAEDISKLEDISTLQYARPAYRPMTNAGIVTSRGDIALKSDKGREDFGVDGSGQKVGILSDSYNSLGGATDGVSSGDLPTGVEILEDLEANEGSDEGRAMAEIIHDIAPGADLAFHTAFLGQASFAQGIIDLANADCDVIVDDVSYFAEPFFQDGIISQAVDEVAQRDVVYLSSAGNSAQQSYESSFNNLGFILADTAGNVLGFPHDFGSGDIYQRYIVPPTGSLILSLQWSDPYFSASGKRGADSDLDLYLLFPQYGDAFFSANDNIDGDPVEITGVINNSLTEELIVDVLIVKYSGPDPELIKYIDFGDFAEPQEYENEINAPTIFGHSNAAQGIAVGATAWFNTPRFNQNVQLPVINGFSSKGGIPILFKDNGKPRDPEIRNKPEVVGPDGGNNTFFGSDLSFAVPGTDEPDGFPNFFGTSASAPHIAGVAALMKQLANNTLDRRTIERTLMNSAVDMDDPTTEGFDKGFDFKTGRGFVQADKALRLVGEQPIPMAAVKPILEAIAMDEKSDKYRAIFGYKSENSVPVYIPIGEKNKFVPDKDRGQVEKFLPGRQYAAFEVTLDPGQTVVWHLEGPDGQQRTATATAPSADQPAARIDYASPSLESEIEELATTDELLPGTYVYPNPSSGTVFLEVVDTPDMPIRLSIFNALGQSVYQTQGMEAIRESVDLAPFGQGLYVVHCDIGDKTTTRKILIK
uniref:S8 family serine peptidase n=1 Tax=Roseihalotalea indica TaxID=2867963 RepID=A0AA49JER2_9BACT|nr:S8 family serine peptidase [Tunicatimonas sp. TK19036]